MTDDVMLQEAIEAIRQKDKARARDLLTRLLKSDQNNAEYWVWMSATVETTKERVYCLETALKLDPENNAAKRGLVLLGARKPDDNLQPFPLKQVRVWEEEIEKEGEEPKEKGFKAFIRHPLVRVIGLLLIGAVAVGALIVLFSAPRTAYYTPTRTAGPSPTFTLTPTAKGAIATQTPNPTFTGPTPLWAMLEATYTPTPLYVEVTHDIAGRDTYRAAMNEFNRGNWEMAITFFQQLVQYEPGAVDGHYYIGEAYRFQEKYQEAFNAYTQATEIDPRFGPAYLGRARVLPYVNSRVDIIEELNQAVEYAPDFLDVYLERAKYYLNNNRPEDALTDLESARGLVPDSPLVQYYLARIYLQRGDNELALEAAMLANELDLTLLEGYLVLGQAYAENDQLENALRVLQTYMIYEPDNPSALTILGAAYNLIGDYESAFEVLNHSLELDKIQGEAYLQRGIAYLELGNGLRAEDDFRNALRFFPRSFQAAIGIARSYYIRENYGEMYNRVEAARSWAVTNEDFAQVYYWRAISLEELGRDDIAYRDWQLLLDLPGVNVPAEWRTYAQERMAAIRTPTPGPTDTPKPTSTPSLTVTP